MMRILTIFIIALANVSSAKLDQLQYLPPHTENQNPHVEHQTHTDDDDYQLLEPPFDHLVGSSLGNKSFELNTPSHTQEETYNYTLQEPRNTFGTNQNYEKAFNPTYNQNYPSTSSDDGQYFHLASTQKDPSKNTKHRLTHGFNSPDVFISSNETQNQFNFPTDQGILTQDNHVKSTSSLSPLVGSINPMDEKKSVFPTFQPIQSQNPFLDNVEPSRNTLEFSVPSNLNPEILNPNHFNQNKNILDTSPKQIKNKYSNKHSLNNPTFEVIPILRSVSKNQDGTYQYAYETANKITAFEEGDARSDGTKAQGYYAYTSPEGKRIEVTYTADERGFLPQGDHIPTAPPVPKAIQKALDYIKRVEEERRLRGEVLDDGQYREEGLRYGGTDENGMRHLEANGNNFSNAVLAEVQETQLPDIVSNRKVKPSSKYEDLQEGGVPSKSLDNVQKIKSESSFLPFRDPTQGKFENENPKLSSQNDASLLKKEVYDSLVPQDTEDGVHEGYTY